MKRLLTFLAIWTLAASAAVAGAADTKDGYTVGDLLLRLAAEMGFKLEQPMPRLARTALATKGIRVDVELDAPLTEGRALAIVNQMGLHLSTQQPDRPMDEARIEMVVSLLRPPYTARRAGSATPPDDDEENRP